MVRCGVVFHKGPLQQFKNVESYRKLNNKLSGSSMSKYS